MKSHKTMTLEALLQNQEKMEREIEIKNREITVLQQRLKKISSKPKWTDQQYQSSFENGKDMIYMHDMEGHFLFLNQTGRDYLGYDVGSDLTDLTIFDVVPEEYWAVVKQRILKKIDNQTDTNYQLEVFARNGRIRTVEISSYILLKEGKPFAIKGIARDVVARKQAERAIVESEQRLLDIINFLPDATFVVDRQGRVIAWNKAIEKMTGVKAEDMLGKGNYEYARPFYGFKRPMLIDLVLSPDAVERDKYLTVEAENNHLTGESICPHIGVKGAILYGTASPLFDPTGKAVGAIESIRDISERRMIEQALRKSEENFRKLAEMAPVFICVMRGKEVVFVNQFALINTGYNESDLANLPPWGFIHPDCRPSVKMKARESQLDIPDRHQIKLITKDSKSIWLDLSISQIDFNGQPCLLGVGVDITERKLAEDQIRYLSYHDKLTGIYNRAYFENKLQDLDKPESMPLSMVMGDLNGLKLINDAFGHEAGDRLLQDVAKVFRSCCRPDDIIARWGGDEFVVLMSNTSEDRASQICENIKKACITLEGFPVKASVSLGVATKDSSKKSMEECAKEAEDRMYRTKMLENKSNRSSFISSLEKTLWVRSHETQAHTWRLRKLVEKIGQALNMPASEIQNLTLLASLHDIGKIAIPNEVLDKPGALSEEEWDLMKKHPEIGYRIALSSPELSSIAEAILAHHERWDGKGYPIGLIGKDIPLIARIVAIADAYDVMISGRPYQKGKTKPEALDEIHHCAGSQFDPHLAKLFIDLLDRERPEGYIKTNCM